MGRVHHRPIRKFEDVKNFVQGITSLRDQSIVAVLLKLCLRAGELCALNFEDVDLDNGFLTVSKHLDKASHEILPGRKNGESSVLPLDDELIKVLRRYIKIRPETNSKALFMNTKGDPIKFDVLRNMLTRWAEVLDFQVNNELCDFNSEFIHLK